MRWNSTYLNVSKEVPPVNKPILYFTASRHSYNIYCGHICWWFSCPCSTYSRNPRPGPRTTGRRAKRVHRTSVAMRAHSQGWGSQLRLRSSLLGPGLGRGSSNKCCGSTYELTVGCARCWRWSHATDDARSLFIARSLSWRFIARTTIVVVLWQDKETLWFCCGQTKHLMQFPDITQYLITLSPLPLSSVVFRSCYSLAGKLWQGILFIFYFFETRSETNPARATNSIPTS